MKPQIAILDPSHHPRKTPGEDPPSISSAQTQTPLDAPDDGGRLIEALGYDDPSSGGSGGLLGRASVRTLSAPDFVESKYPGGKSAAESSTGGGWLSSIDAGREGVLAEGWTEKHSGGGDGDGALPSAILVVVTADETPAGPSGNVEGESSRLVSECRSLLAEKRSAPIHACVLLRSPRRSRGAAPAEARGEKILRTHRDAALRERVGQGCRLPSSQVWILRGEDLESDEWEERVMGSPYASITTATGSSSAAASSPSINTTATKIMKPPLRTLAASLLRSSSTYYSSLAERSETKLHLWRNRYHSTNSSFELNCLVCAVRCARYAFKSGVLRELEHSAGEPSDRAGAAQQSQRHYEEAYRWVLECHRRIARWRGGSSADAAPATPGASNEPKFFESPGGGIGVELSLPAVAERAVPPQGTPGLTSKRGAARDLPFYSSLYQQCRAVASLLNVKLMNLQNTPRELERQWRRHRLAFVGNHGGDDALYGPMWHRAAYAWKEMEGYASISERMWRNDATADPESLSPAYPAAPWRIYGELAEVSLGVGKEVKAMLKGGAWKDPEDDGGGNRGRLFVGAVVAGGGEGSWQWYFEKESRKNHPELALEYALHALALLKENDSICQSVSDAESQLLPNAKRSTPSAAVRLHYLAGRLLSVEDPENALAHFQIAAQKTKKWPSMHLTIQRALLECEKKCRAGGGRDASIKMLFEPGACAILSESEIAQAQSLAGNSSEPKQVAWTDDEAGASKPPLEFAATFLNSTHAMSGDTVLACVSVKSCLDIPVYVESIQLNTTAGSYGIANLQEHVNKATLQSWLKPGTPKREIDSDVSSVGSGIELGPKGLAYFFTEVKLPSSLVETALGNGAADLSKFHPKNGKLCNMGFTVAAGNLCKSRFKEEYTRIFLDGKPVAVQELPEESTSFFGGVPLVCHGLTLMVKPSSNSSDSLLTLQIDRKHLISPLGRTDALQYLMEECNYMAHSWSRPAHHPWYLGPRCLRVLGPRPHMEVTNMTEQFTGGNAVEGTVNRILFKLEAGKGYDCRDVTVRLRCSSLSHVDVSSEGEADEAKLDNHTLFVQQSLDAGSKVTVGEGVKLPLGWEPRCDVSTDETHDASTVVSSHLEAGQCMLLPLDLFRPLNTSDDNTTNAGSISTSYEVILTYREVRLENNGDGSGTPGNQVMVIQRGHVNWIRPFTANFTVTDGQQKAFPCGVQHPSNTSDPAASSSSRTEEQPGIISADGERVRMRFVLKTNGLGSNVAASVQSVINEIETDQKQKELYSSSDSTDFMTRAKQGSKLSMSYLVTTQRNSSHSNEYVTMPLGVISVNWKPVSLTLPSESSTQELTATDEFGMDHGPLTLPDIAPMIFYGPQCQVLNAPFTAKLLKVSSPKVGIPFCITYQIKNKTAKSQTLTFSLSNGESSGDESTSTSPEQLLIAGKVKGELHISPFEVKSFPFTFMSMVAGKVRCPSLQVSSGRHQSWVINESAVKERYFFVMP